MALDAAVGYESKHVPIYEGKPMMVQQHHRRAHHPGASHPLKSEPPARDCVGATALCSADPLASSVRCPARRAPACSLAVASASACSCATTRSSTCDASSSCWSRCLPPVQLRCGHPRLALRLRLGEDGRGAGDGDEFVRGVSESGEWGIGKKEEGRGGGVLGGCREGDCGCMREIRMDLGTEGGDRGDGGEKRGERGGQALGTRERRENDSTNDGYGNERSEEERERRAWKDGGHAKKKGKGKRKSAWVCMGKEAKKHARGQMREWEMKIAVHPAAAPTSDAWHSAARHVCAFCWKSASVHMQVRMDLAAARLVRLGDLLELGFESRDFLHKGLERERNLGVARLLFERAGELKGSSGPREDGESDYAKRDSSPQRPPAAAALSTLWRFTCRLKSSRTFDFDMSESGDYAKPDLEFPLLAVAVGSGRGSATSRFGVVCPSRGIVWKRCNALPPPLLLCNFIGSHKCRGSSFRGWSTQMKSLSFSPAVKQPQTVAAIPALMVGRSPHMGLTPSSSSRSTAGR
ncbi:hypothetical protein FB451DRAFT_1191114 [Mycena latifolia]|nr:hypothetical protein FB451DRAFT_1191114 [Mycena latifolia]